MAPLLEVSFLVGFRIGPTFAVMLSLFGAICSVFAGTGPFWKGVWTGLGHIFATLQYMRWAPGWIKLKPEVLQKQVGKLAEEYGAFFVVVTLRDGFIVLQVESVTDIKFLRFLKKEDLAHPEAPQQEPQEQGSFFRLIFGEDRIHRFEWYYRCVKFLPASWKYISATASIGTGGRSSKECDPNVSVRRIEPSFRKGEGRSLSGIDSVWHPILLGIRRYVTSVSCTSTSQGDFEHSLSGI